MKGLSCIFIIVTALIFTSCKNPVEPVANNAGTYDSNGAIKTINGKIRNWTYGDSLMIAMSYSKENLIICNRAKVNADGSFSMKLEAPPLERPRPFIKDPRLHLSDSTAVLTYMDNFCIFKDSAFTDIPGRKLPAIYRCVEYLNIEGAENMDYYHRYFAEWVYASKPLKVTGVTQYNGVPTDSVIYNLDLKKGWNKVHNKILLAKENTPGAYSKCYTYSDNSLKPDWNFSWR